MVNGSRQIAHVVVLVVDAQAVEQYLVIDERQAVVAQGVGGVERRDGGMAVDAQSASQVDGVKGPGQSQVAVAVSCDF